MKNLIYLALLMPCLGNALEFTLNNVNCGSLNASDCNALQDDIRNFEDLPDVSIDKYADGVSDANAFALKGQSSDYADNFSFITVKPSFGIAIKGDPELLSDDPESAEGIGLGAALSVGLNMSLLPVNKIGPIDFNKLDVFVSFMSYSLNQDTDGTEIDGEIGSFGVFARYRLIDSVDIVPGYLVEWGGLHLHTGIQRSSMNIDVNQNLDNETVTSGGLNAEFQNGFARFGLETENTSIPIEVSTFLRLGYVFTFYGGAGFDYTFGSSDITFNADGDISESGSGFSAEVAASEGADGGPEATAFRSFAGLQFNVPFARLYAQFNKGIGNDLNGVNLGAKFTW